MHKLSSMLMLAGVLAAPLAASAQAQTQWSADRPQVQWSADAFERGARFDARSERLAWEQVAPAASKREPVTFGWNSPTQAQQPVSYLDVDQVSAVPEPTTTALLLAGLGVVVLLARRRRRGED